LLAWLAFLMGAATVAGIGVAWVLAQQADDDLDASRRRALRETVEALQAVSPSYSEVEPRRIPMLERASGLKGLRFESDPPGAGRNVQSLTDQNGRIVGWFSWEPERPARAMMLQLSPFGALIAAGLLGFAVLALWRLKRLTRALAQSEHTHERHARQRRRRRSHRGDRHAPAPSRAQAHDGRPVAR
jgi:hypothetical protein